MRQSGLLTNPSLGVAVDNFAGPDELEGFDGAETTVTLSQLIGLGTAQPGTIDQYIDLPGEIVLNANHTARVVPRVAGIVREVRKTEGDSVRAGELLAVLESRELADAKADYLAAVEREKMALINYEREERLWQKQVTSEQEYLAARQAMAEARIARSSVEQQLHTLGCSEADLISLPGKHGSAFTHYEVTAPLAGTIIERQRRSRGRHGAQTDRGQYFEGYIRRQGFTGQNQPGASRRVHVVPYYDQATLVARCVKTVTDALVFGDILVAGVLLIFMGGLRPSVVVALSIPFSIFFAFILMNILGISASLMSLGGLAIAIGMMVDATIVMVENVDRMLREAEADDSRISIVARACGEVGRPILFAIAIIIIVFLPLFALQGVAGKTFRPLAYTAALAMFGSLIYALLLAPVAAHLLMKRPKSLHDTSSREAWIVGRLLRIYQPMVKLFVYHRLLAVGLALLMLASGILIFPQLGSEFMPRLEEGDLLIRATLAPSISLEGSRDAMLRFERRLMEKFPEVTRVVTRVGRGEVGAHAGPVNSAEAFVALKPQEQWTSASTPDELYAKISSVFEDFPGAQFNVTQPIAAAVDELLTGTKAELAIKIFGPDMEVLKEKAAEIEEILGPRQISRENNQRFITVQCNVRGRDIGSFVTEAQDAIAHEVSLPPGYLVSWGGQFEL